MASDNEASCVCDPNFAVICSFLEKFAKSCGITYPNFLDLQEMLENSQEVPQPLVDLHVKLLRKARKSVSGERWERALIKFCHSYSNQDGWEVERFGYKKARLAVKLRILKMLLELQFDLNSKFKTEVNRLSAEELRSQPLGRDKLGQSYWCQLDEDCNLRVYREDLDDETWEVVARDREGLVQLISQLSSNDPFRNYPDAVLNEDSNSLEIEKPITDTGQVIESPIADEDEDGEFEEIEEEEDDEEEEETNEFDKDRQKELKTNLGPKPSNFETKKGEIMKSSENETKNDTKNNEILLNVTNAASVCNSVDAVCGKQKREQKSLKLADHGLSSAPSEERKKVQDSVELADRNKHGIFVKAKSNDQESSEHSNKDVGMDVSKQGELLVRDASKEAESVISEDKKLYVEIREPVKSKEQESWNLSTKKDIHVSDFKAASSTVSSEKEKLLIREPKQGEETVVLRNKGKNFSGNATNGMKPSVETSKKDGALAKSFLQCMSLRPGDKSVSLDKYIYSSKLCESKRVVDSMESDENSTFRASYSVPMECKGGKELREKICLPIRDSQDDKPYGQGTGKEMEKPTIKIKGLLGSVSGDIADCIDSGKKAMLIDSREDTKNQEEESTNPSLSGMNTVISGGENKGLDLSGRKGSGSHQNENKKKVLQSNFQLKDQDEVCDLSTTKSTDNYAVQRESVRHSIHFLDRNIDRGSQNEATDLSTKKSSATYIDYCKGKRLENMSKIERSSAVSMGSDAYVADIKDILRSKETSKSGGIKRTLNDTEDLSLAKKLRSEDVVNTSRGAVEIGEVVEEPLMLIRGDGSGKDCKMSNPESRKYDINDIEVGEAIEEPLLFVYGEGSGKDCGTGNQGKDAQNDEKDGSKSSQEANGGDSSSLDSNVKNFCVSEYTNRKHEDLSSKEQKTVGTKARGTDVIECGERKEDSKEGDDKKGLVMKTSSDSHVMFNVPHGIMKVVPTDSASSELKNKAFTLKSDSLLEMPRDNTFMTISALNPHVEGEDNDAANKECLKDISSETKADDAVSCTQTDVDGTSIDKLSDSHKRPSKERTPTCHEEFQDSKRKEFGNIVKEAPDMNSSNSEDRKEIQIDMQDKGMKDSNNTKLKQFHPSAFSQNDIKYSESNCSYLTISDSKNVALSNSLSSDVSGTVCRKVPKSKENEGMDTETSSRDCQSNLMSSRKLDVIVPMSSSGTSDFAVCGRDSGASVIQTEPSMQSEDNVCREVANEDHVKNIKIPSKELDGKQEQITTNKPELEIETVRQGKGPDQLFVLPLKSQYQCEKSSTLGQSVMNTSQQMSLQRAENMGELLNISDKVVNPKVTDAMQCDSLKAAESFTKPCELSMSLGRTDSWKLVDASAVPPLLEKKPECTKTKEQLHVSDSGSAVIISDTVSLKQGISTESDGKKSELSRCSEAPLPVTKRFLQHTVNIITSCDSSKSLSPDSAKSEVPVKVSPVKAPPKLWSIETICAPDQKPKESICSPQGEVLGNSGSSALKAADVGPLKKPELSVHTGKPEALKPADVGLSKKPELLCHTEKPEGLKSADVGLSKKPELSCHTEKPEALKSADVGLSKKPELSGHTTKPKWSLGVQVIQKSTSDGSSCKRASRWDVGKPSDTKAVASDRKSSNKNESQNLGETCAVAKNDSPKDTVINPTKILKPSVPNIDSCFIEKYSNDEFNKTKDNNVIHDKKQEQVDFSSESNFPVSSSNIVTGSEFEEKVVCEKEHTQGSCNVGNESSNPVEKSPDTHIRSLLSSGKGLDSKLDAESSVMFDKHVNVEHNACNEKDEKVDAVLSDKLTKSELSLYGQNVEMQSRISLQRSGNDKTEVAETVSTDISQRQLPVVGDEPVDYSSQKLGMSEKSDTGAEFFSNHSIVDTEKKPVQRFFFGPGCLQFSDKKIESSADKAVVSLIADNKSSIRVGENTVNRITEKAVNLAESLEVNVERKVVEGSSNIPVLKEKDISTNKLDGKPVDAPSERNIGKVIDFLTKKSVGKTMDKLSDKILEKSMDITTDKFVKNLVDVTTEKSSITVTDIPTEKSARKAEMLPLEKISDKPVDSINVSKAADETAVRTSQQTKHITTEKTVGKVLNTTDETIEKSLVISADKTNAESSVNKTVGKAGSISFDKTYEKSMAVSADTSAGKGIIVTDKTIDKCIDFPVNRAVGNVDILVNKIVTTCKEKGADNDIVSKSVGEFTDKIDSKPTASSSDHMVNKIAGIITDKISEPIADTRKHKPVLQNSSVDQNFKKDLDMGVYRESVDVGSDKTGGSLCINEDKIVKNNMDISAERAVAEDADKTVKESLEIGANKAVEKLVVVGADRVVEKDEDVCTDKNVEKGLISDKLSEKSFDIDAVKNVEKSSDINSGEAVEKRVDIGSDRIVARPVNVSRDKSVGKAIIGTVDKIHDKPMDITAKKSLQLTTDKPIAHPADYTALHSADISRNKTVVETVKASNSSTEVVEKTVGKGVKTSIKIGSAIIEATNKTDGKSVESCEKTGNKDIQVADNLIGKNTEENGRPVDKAVETSVIAVSKTVEMGQKSIDRVIDMTEKTSGKAADEHVYISDDTIDTSFLVGMDAFSNKIESPLSLTKGESSVKKTVDICADTTAKECLGVTKCDVKCVNVTSEKNVGKNMDDTDKAVWRGDSETHNKSTTKSVDLTANKSIGKGINVASDKSLEKALDATTDKSKGKDDDVSDKAVVKTTDVTNDKVAGKSLLTSDGESSQDMDVITTEACERNTDDIADKICKNNVGAISDKSFGNIMDVADRISGNTAIDINITKTADEAATLDKTVCKASDITNTTGKVTDVASGKDAGKSVDIAVAKEGSKSDTAEKVANVCIEKVIAKGSSGSADAPPHKKASEEVPIEKPIMKSVEENLKNEAATSLGLKPLLMQGRGSSSSVCGKLLSQGLIGSGRGRRKSVENITMGIMMSKLAGKSGLDSQTTFSGPLSSDSKVLDRITCTPTVDIQHSEKHTEKVEESTIVLEKPKPVAEPPAKSEPAPKVRTGFIKLTPIEKLLEKPPVKFQDTGVKGPSLPLSDSPERPSLYPISESPTEKLVGTAVKKNVPGFSMTPILKHSLEHKLPSHSGILQTIKKSDSSYVVFVPDTQMVRSSIGKAEGKRLTNQKETLIQESRQTGNKLSGMEDKSDSKVESQEEGPHLIQSSEKLPQTVCTPGSVIEVSSLQVSSSKVEKKVEDVTMGTKDLNTVSSKVSEAERCKAFPDKEKETKSGSTDVQKAVSEEKDIDGRVITSSTRKSPASIRGKGDKVKGSIVSKILPKSSDRTKADDCLPEGRPGVADVTPVLKDIESETLELPIKKAPEDTKDTKPEVSLKRVMKKDSSKTVSVRSPMSGKLKGENRKEGKTISPKSEDISKVKEVMPKKEIEINSRLRIQDLTFDYAPPKTEEKEILSVKTRIQTRQHGKLPAKLPSSEKPKKGNKTSKSASMASLNVDSSKHEEDVIYIAEKDPLAGADDGFPVTRSRRTRSSTALFTPVDIKKPQPPSKKGSKAEVPIEKSVQKGKLIGQKRRNSRRLDSQSDEGEVVTDGRRKRSLAEVETDEDAGGKRRKLRSRRTPDVQLRRSIEEQKRLEGGYSSSDDDHGDDMVISLEGESTDESQPSAAEEVIPCGRGRPLGRACGKGRGRGKGKGGVVSLTATDSPAVSSDAPSDMSRTELPVISEVPATPKSSPRKTRRLLGLDVGVDIILEETSKEGGAGPSSGMPVRQSRRIAQIKIKEEAERRKLEELTLLELKEQQRRRKRDEKHETKECKSDKRKRKKKTVESDEDYTAEDEVEEPATSKKKKKKKKKRKKKSGKGFSDNPWQSTSGSSSSSLEEEDEQEQTEEEDESNIVFKSDHEFSPESDLENEDVEVQPTRRARTAQKESDGEEPADDHACQKCGKSDHPEWILLCDKCDSGWHGSCLRPALLVIPEGDWFCPPCEHTFLLTNLQNNLKEFDRALKRRENEELRRKRLAYVGISLDNVLPNKEKDAGASGGESDHASKAGKLSSSSSSSSSDSGSSSGDESEPLYHLRERRQTLFSYRFNEYDDLINSAIQDELEAVKGAGNQGRGKDIATIVNAEKEEMAAAGVGLEEVEKDSQDAKQDGKLTELEDEQEEAVEAEEEEEDGYIPPVRKFLGRKKHRRLNSLDISSEDDADSDEDFKGTSSEDEDEEEEEEELELDESEDSDVVGRNRKGGSGRRRRNAEPVRRSTRARITRFDKEFINDDSDESIEPRRKKTRRLWQDSDSEESDSTWGQKKRRKHHLDSHKPKSKKKKRKKHMKDLDDEYNKNKPKNPRIKYGGLDDDETSPLPRTRGRKINYQEVAGSESEEELMKAVTKQLESEEEYVASEEEQMMMEEEEDEPEGEEVEGVAEAEVKSEHQPEPEAEEKAEAKVEAEDQEEEEPRRKEPAVQPVEEEPPLKVGRKKKEKSEKKPRAVKKRRSPNKPKTEKKNKTERKPRKAKPTRMKKQIIRDDTEDELQEFGEDFENLEEGEVRLGTVLGEREELMDEELLEEELVNEEKEMDEMLEEELLEKEMLEDEDDDEFLAMKEAELALQQAELTKAKEKRRQKREAKKLEKKEQKKRGRKPKKLDEVESVQPVLISTLADKKHPVQKSVEIESELSKNVEPPPAVPPIILPVVCTSSPAPVVSTPTPAKRRGRGRGKATLAAAAAADTTTTAVALAGKLPANGQMGSTPLSGMASSCFPGPNQQQPQQLPFCTQPPHSSNSVITRMLQSQPVSGGPQSFTAAATAMGHKYFGGPGNDQLPLVGPGSGNSGSGLGVGTGPSGRGAVSTAQSYSIPARGRIPSPYRQPPPLTSSPSGSPGICLPHYASPRGSPIRPPPGSIQQTAMSPLRMRTSGPGSQGPQLYHTSHHPLDPSPSGGGPIAIATNNGVRPGGEGSPLHQPPTQIPPSAGSPLAGKPGPSPTSHSTPPPPPYTRVVPPPMHQQVPPPLIRFPLQSADGNPQGRHPQSQFPPSTTAGNHLPQAQHSPPPHQGRSPAPGNFSPYHPPPPPNYHYGAYPPPPPLAAADDALPPSAYQGSPYPDHYASPDASHSLQASDGSNSKSYDEEGGGEFGGLVSYFSSQREDDLDT